VLERLTEKPWYVATTDTTTPNTSALVSPDTTSPTVSIDISVPRYSPIGVGLIICTTMNDPMRPKMLKYTVSTSIDTTTPMKRGTTR